MNMVFNQGISNIFIHIDDVLLISYIRSNDIRCIYWITYSVSHLKKPFCLNDMRSVKNGIHVLQDCQKMVGGFCILFYELCLTRGLIIYVHNSDHFLVNSNKAKLHMCALLKDAPLFANSFYSLKSIITLQSIIYGFLSLAL